MMRILSAVTAIALLSGCATATPPAQVTRFHQLSTAATQMPYFIAAPDDAAAGPEWATYAAAVSAQMQRIGFTCALRSGGACVLPQSSALQPAPAQVVIVRLDRAQNSGGGARGSGINVGLGGSTGSYGSGVGVGVGIDLGRLFRGGGGPQTAIRLSVRIDQPRGTAVWEGRAETLVRGGTPADQPGLAAARLASALFAGFPGTSGQTITVP